MLKIKFKKTGKKGQKHLRLVVAEKRSKLDGRNVDDLGWINPHEKTANFDKEKALYWIEKGAKPTASVMNLLIKKGVVKGKKIAVHAKSKKQEETKPAPAPETKKEADENNNS